MIDRAILDAARRDRALLVRALQEAGASLNGQAALRCPFHDDQTPSGSIHQGDDGCWRYSCHACTWNGTKRTGDAIAVVMRARNCTFNAACQHLGISTDTGDAKSRPDRARDAFDASRFAREAAARLLNDPKLLDELWRTRGIDSETVRRLGIGVSSDRRYWTLPIADRSGRTVAVKHHRVRAGAEPKSLWLPRGTDRKQVFPLCLAGDGPAWLCPGELKAAAVVGVGLPAVGITSGEGSQNRPESLPDALVAMLVGREVAIVADDDSTGAAWAVHVRAQLVDAGIEARVVDIGLNKASGLKDVGDVITRQRVEDAKEPEAVAEWLRHCWRQSDQWQQFAVGAIWQQEATWKRVEHIATGFRALDEALGGGLRTRGVHLLVGRPGKGKTQTAIQLAVNVAKAAKPVGIISLELDRQEVARLAMAQLADVPRAWLDGGDLVGAAADRFSVARRERASMPLTILDDDFWRGGLDRDRLAGIVAEGVRRFGWRLVVLDYLGLLARGEVDRSEYETDLLNSTALRRIARHSNVAMLVVCALRKAATFKDSRDRPFSLDDVIGAGRIVYDATTVWGIDAEQGPAVPGRKPTGIIRLIPLKTRFASAAATHDDVVLRWYPGTGAIVDLEGDTG